MFPFPSQRVQLLLSAIPFLLCRNVSPFVNIFRHQKFALTSPPACNIIRVSQFLLQSHCYNIPQEFSSDVFTFYFALKSQTLRHCKFSLFLSLLRTSGFDVLWRTFCICKKVKYLKWTLDSIPSTLNYFYRTESVSLFF